MDDKIYSAFDAVHAQDELKERTKTFLAAKTRSARKPARAYRMAAALACLALVLFGFGGWRLYVTPVYAISMDVNPSIELGVNRFDRVVSVDGYNEDGTALAAGADLTSLEYSEALSALLASDEMAAYLENDALVSITVVAADAQKAEAMRARIAECDYASSGSVECHSGDKDELEHAHESGLSYGKYEAFLELQALDPNVTAQDVSGMTMRQIRDRIAALSSSADAQQQGCGSGSGQGNGNGQHHGND